MLLLPGLRRPIVCVCIRERRRVGNAISGLVYALLQRGGGTDGAYRNTHTQAQSCCCLLAVAFSEQVASLSLTAAGGSHPLRLAPLKNLIALFAKTTTAPAPQQRCCNISAARAAAEAATTTKNENCSKCRIAAATKAAKRAKGVGEAAAAAKDQNTWK